MLADGVLLPVRPLLCVPSGRLAANRSVEGVTVATTRRIVDVIRQGAPLPASDVERATTRALALLRPAVLAPQLGPISPFARANSTSSARVSSPSFRMMWARWVSTVRTEM